MAFFLWFQRKSSQKALAVTAVTMAAIIFALAVMPGNGGATVGLEQPKSIMSIKKTPVIQDRPAPAQVSRGNDISRDDLVLMARVIEGEAADEPYIGKVAVGAVILNRTREGEFPRTVKGVIYEPDAFEAVTNGQYLRPLSQESLAAAREAVNGHDPTGGALYYWNPAKASSPWVWSRPIVTRIGNHVFAK
ncbi:cell wall hydrolase [Desulfofundulus thermobenzoicus]|uniref:Cell wall hydrolase n=1 Tax=Desulfofundulus thermobenzoicus TaxID=29376 RepID=A0A6N7IR69_9FIRM|nr:cell wall hydrolase [Desulfofundulus thermobenzoicus]MQL52532.1 cell wall hydrolase [Desulfofundulus thermobenzoicus]